MDGELADGLKLRVLGAQLLLGDELCKLVGLMLGLSVVVVVLGNMLGARLKLGENVGGRL